MKNAPKVMKRGVSRMRSGCRIGGGRKGRVP